jgi:hypothetical protein
MRKLALPMILLALTFTIQAAKADGPPAADVSCSLTDTGVRYGVSMVFTGSGVSFNSLRYEWDVLVAEAGKNPTLISSYGPRTLYTTTTGNGLELTYETILGIAKNDPNASLLVYANSVFSDGISTLTNKTGKGCYVSLPDVLKNKNDRALVLQKAAADKAAADKAAADKAAADKAAIERILQGLIAKSQAADDLIAKYSEMSPVMKVNLAKFSFSRPTIPVSITPDFTLANAQDLDARFNQFTTNLNAFIQTLSKNTATTISCVKGKVVKKVTAVGPKCPVGYKVK